MTKIIEIWSCSCNILKSSCKHYRSHVIINGLVTFWLIFTSVYSDFCDIKCTKKGGLQKNFNVQRL
jgi:hypothetical protein